TCELLCFLVKDCGFPPYMDGATVDYTNTVFGAEANYLCVKGYSSSGNGTTVCLSSGSWSETDLLCSASFHSTWQQVATTKASSTTLHQKQKLMNRLSANCKPNVRVKAGFKAWDRVTYLSSYDKRMDGKCFGQSVRGLTKSSWDSFETSPQREFEIFVPHAQSTHMSVDDSRTVTKSSYDGNFIWLVKDDQCMSTSYSSDSGSVFTSLFEGEADPFFDTYYLDENTNTACGQRTVHVSTNPVMTFQTPPYWYVRKDCPSGKHILRWNVTGEFHNTEKNFYSKPWCPDTCWHHVFNTKTSPTNNAKHIRHLFSGVQYGHNVMLKVEHVVTKAREVILHDGHVTVGVKEFWLPADNDAFSSGSLQAWMIASTTGRVVECAHFPESFRVKDIKKEEKHSDWFLDSRQWDKVLSIDGTGTVLSGSKSTLLNNVNEGRSLRVGVLHTNGIYKALDLDTVDVSRTGQIAANIIHNVDLVLGRGNNVRFTDTCRMVSSIITTEGSYKIYTYNIGAGGNHSIVTGVAKIEWFIEL
ncbi:uncharacterized protein, partial [Haliotis asinina]|uniref:uncharacterized protein n=1 Tax=Haliotis asinina TaxID=109174 RepID=UPI003531CFC1